MAGNTLDACSCTNLELYYPDDNSAAGETKANVLVQWSYIAPKYLIHRCLSTECKDYNVQLTASATKNNLVEDK
jgi:hypothetical protein